LSIDALFHQHQQMFATSQQQLGKALQTRRLGNQKLEGIEGEHVQEN
jgi:hypothetical protein